MKKIITLVSIAFLLINFITKAQTTGNNGIVYTYDASGNRTHRAPATSSGKKAGPGNEDKNKGKQEGEKNNEGVAKNENLQNSNSNIQANITPNPTNTGKFTVTVSKKDLSTISSKNSSLEKPVIYIYNPLGELIEQLSAQYETPANLNLSGLAKGIYFVKAQSGDDVVMHKVVYE